MRNQGDSLELLSLSLVLDVRHSAKAQEGELQVITKTFKPQLNSNKLLRVKNLFTCLDSLKKKGKSVSQHLDHLKKKEGGGLKKAEVLSAAADTLSQY